MLWMPSMFHVPCALLHAMPHSDMPVSCHAMPCHTMLQRTVRGQVTLEGSVSTVIDMIWHAVHDMRLLALYSALQPSSYDTVSFHMRPYLIVWQHVTSWLRMWCITVNDGGVWFLSYQAAHCSSMAPFLCHEMLCYAVVCCAVLCYAMLCYAMLCYAMHCAVLRCAMCRAVQCAALCCRYRSTMSVLQHAC